MNSPLDEINKLADKLPVNVLKDIHQRIGDWLNSGGNEDDPYIHQQLRYATKILISKGL